MIANNKRRTAWLPGALRLALGFGLLALGDYLINL